MIPAILPVEFTWTEDGVMKPLDRWVGRCNHQFCVGETYRLTVEEERSTASQGHYFAALKEGWQNLREDLAPSFPSPEHLRKWCLVKSGHANERSIVCQTAADASRFAEFMKHQDEYAVVVHKGNVLKVFTAKSQSVRSMKKDEFEKSKRDVLELVASMARTTQAQLYAEAGQHD